MPNNTIITPTEEATGTAVLPLARVKKCISADEDISAVSAQAAFIITKATELFLQYLADRSFSAAKAGTKAKKTLRYKDISNIIVRTDNLEFLSDVVPQTTTWRAHKETKSREGAVAGKADFFAPAGRTTLDIRHPMSSHRDKQMGPPMAGSSKRIVNGGPSPNGGSALVFQHYEPNGASKVDEDGDVEMG